MLSLYNQALLKKFDVLKTIFDKQREGLKRDTYFLDVPSTTKLCDEIKTIVQDTIARYAVPHLSSGGAPSAPNPNTPSLATLSTQNLSSMIGSHEAGPNAATQRLVSLGQPQAQQPQMPQAQQKQPQVQSQQQETAKETENGGATPPQAAATPNDQTDFSKMLAASGYAALLNGGQPTATANAALNNALGMGGFSAFLGAPGLSFLSNGNGDTANPNSGLGVNPGNISQRNGLGVNPGNMPSMLSLSANLLGAQTDTKSLPSADSSADSALSSLQTSKLKPDPEKEATSTGGLGGDDFNFYFDLESPISSPRHQPTTQLDSLGINSESPVERKKRRVS
jgi:hypothetical protein